VNAVSRTYGGRAIRWLGDGGLLLFHDAGTAARAALEMSERAPVAGLPPTHIGIQAGPVVFRDGDVYGRTTSHRGSRTRPALARYSRARRPLSGSTAATSGSSVCGPWTCRASERL
jgi:hypothetical protein